jgi:hypothetical protein
MAWTRRGVKSEEEEEKGGRENFGKRSNFNGSIATAFQIEFAWYFS